MVDIVGYRSSFYWSFRYWATQYFTTHPAEVEVIAEALIIRISTVLKAAAAGLACIMPAVDPEFKRALAGLAAYYQEAVAAAGIPGAEIAVKNSGAGINHKWANITAGIRAGAVSSGLQPPAADPGRKAPAASILVKSPALNVELIQ